MTRQTRSGTAETQQCPQFWIHVVRVALLLDYNSRYLLTMQKTADGLSKMFGKYTDWVSPIYLYTIGGGGAEVREREG